MNNFIQVSIFTLLFAGAIGGGYYFYNNSSAKPSVVTESSTTPSEKVNPGLPYAKSDAEVSDVVETVKKNPNRQ